MHDTVIVSLAGVVMMWFTDYGGVEGGGGDSLPICLCRHGVLAWWCMLGVEIEMFSVIYLEVAVMDVEIGERERDI